MPLASQTFPSGSGAGNCPPGVLPPEGGYDFGASALGETPLPRQIAVTRNRSVSKHAQRSLPRFSTSPRGVRLFVGNPSPALRASRMDEKNGNSGSTHSAHGEGVVGLSCFFFAAASSCTGESAKVIESAAAKQNR